jgi:DNA modification methylase
MIQKDLLSLACPISKLSLLPGNPRRGDVDAVKASLEKFGQRKPIVVRKSDQVVIAGNHTLQAAQALGWSEIAVVWVDDDDTMSKAFALADNRTAELGDYDEDALAALIGEVGALDPELLQATGWDSKSVSDLLDSMQKDLPVDVDEVPDEVPAISKLGDVWLLGEHRVMCGDSLIVDNLDRLMKGMKAGCILTDPPYGINLDTDYSQSEVNKGKNYKKVLNDDKPFDASLIYKYFESVKEQFWWGADYYRRTIADTELSGSWLVWDKRVDEHLDSVIGSAFELCWSRTRHQRKILRYQWTNYTSHENAGHKRAHPTEKPVAMLLHILNDYAEDRCVVVDLFGGSGSTLIAAQETNRVAYLMELDPQYIDVICARFQKHTGILPVLESDGLAHDFSADA